VSDSTAYDYLELFGLVDANVFESSASLASASQSYTVTNEMLTAAFASIANDGIYRRFRLSLFQTFQQVSLNQLDKVYQLV